MLIVESEKLKAGESKSLDRLLNKNIFSAMQHLFLRNNLNSSNLFNYANENNICRVSCLFLVYESSKIAYIFIEVLGF